MGQKHPILFYSITHSHIILYYIVCAFGLYLLLLLPGPLHETIPTHHHHIIIHSHSHIYIYIYICTPILKRRYSKRKEKNCQIPFTDDWCAQPNLINPKRFSLFCSVSVFIRSFVCVVSLVSSILSTPLLIHLVSSLDFFIQFHIFVVLFLPPLTDMSPPTLVSIFCVLSVLYTSLSIQYVAKSGFWQLTAQPTQLGSISIFCSAVYSFCHSWLWLPFGAVETNVSALILYIRSIVSSIERKLENCIWFSFDLLCFACERMCQFCLYIIRCGDE